MNRTLMHFRCDLKLCGKVYRTFTFYRALKALQELVDAVTVNKAIEQLLTTYTLDVLNNLIVFNLSKRLIIVGKQRS